MSKFSTPAPGEYDIQKAVKAINQSTPKYTFGQKLAAEKFNTTPGKLRRIEDGFKKPTFVTWLVYGV